MNRYPKALKTLGCPINDMVDLPKTESADYFADIANDLMDAHLDVKIGEMLNNPSMKLSGRNFAVFVLESDCVAFRLGKDFDVDAFGLKTATHFNPSPDKPPMTDWYVVEFADKDKWVMLLKLAFELLQKDLSK